MKTTAFGFIFVVFSGFALMPFLVQPDTVAGAVPADHAAHGDAAGGSPSSRYPAIAGTAARSGTSLDADTAFRPPPAVRLADAR